MSTKIIYAVKLVLIITFFVDCTPNIFVCGNGIKEDGEVCDNRDFGELSCRSYGFTRGVLTCSFDCDKITTEKCISTEVKGICGDGFIDPNEECDSQNLGNNTCISKGYSGGEIFCNSQCKYDVSKCTEDKKTECNLGYKYNSTTSSCQKQCISNTDCPNGFICNKCSYTCEIDHADRCIETYNCLPDPNDFICDRCIGQCKPKITISCKSDLDCKLGYVCNLCSNTCVNSHKQLSGNPAKCTQSYPNCPGDQYCNLCVNECFYKSK